MANIFPPNTNKRFYGIAALVALAAAFVLGEYIMLISAFRSMNPCSPSAFPTNFTPEI